MKHMRPVRRWMAVVIAMLVLAGSVFAAAAMEPQRPASLTLSFGRDGTGFSGVSFRLYRVAAVDSAAAFTLEAPFSAYPISLEGLTSAHWRALAQTLEGYVLRDGLTPDQTGATDDDGSLTFSGLLPGLYLLLGEPCESDGWRHTPEPLLVMLSMEAPDGAVTVKFDREPLPTETRSYTVVKIWEDGGSDGRPQEITVELLQDGQVYDTVVLSAANNWRHTWDGLDAGSRWHVVEGDVPAGYTAAVVREGTVFALTNTAEAPPEAPEKAPPSGETLPNTGVLWWPVPVLALAGLTLFALGWGRRRHEKG